MTIDLSRFVDAQRRDVEQAIGEIVAGRKRSHWIWYVLPQIAGLGASPTARFYGITSVAEARAFLEHPELGANYRRTVAAILGQMRRGVDLHTVFGWPDDAKTVSSLTLFAGIADPDDELVTQVQEIFATGGLTPCAPTQSFLAAG